MNCGSVGGGLTERRGKAEPGFWAERRRKPGGANGVLVRTPRGTGGTGRKGAGLAR